MIYIFKNPGSGASIVYDEKSLSEEEKAQAIQVTELPQVDYSRGSPMLNCNKETGEIWWEYIPREKTNEELQQAIELMQQALDELLLGGL